jgi:ATP:ADP antiporter, AAA family
MKERNNEETEWVPLSVAKQFKTQNPSNQIAVVEKEKLNFFERFLGLFTEVRRGEEVTAILLMLNLFILLCAYLLIKTLREPLILTGGGPEVKSYAAAGHALLLLFIVPLYGSLASRVNRIELINRVTLFFISNLIGFYILAQFEVPLGVVFFLWVGIFNLLLVAQFWSFANDIYTPEQGTRLFAIVAVGGSLGGLLGPMIAKWLFHPLGPYRLMLVAAAMLGAALVITNIVNAREKHRSRPGVKGDESEQPLGKEGGFHLVMGQRYLLLVALLVILSNLVKTTGEFILSKKVTEEARQAVVSEERQVAVVNVAATPTAVQSAKAEQYFIGQFYGNFFFWVNLFDIFIQLFFVSRIFKYLGISGALFFLPAIAFGSYSLIALAPVLSYIQIAKVMENGTDYSLQNTTRQALFLPTSRDAKYKAKAAIDTFFVRFGDVLSACVVFIGTRFFLETQAFAAINAAVVVVWLGLVAAIRREYTRVGPTINCQPFN